MADKWPHLFQSDSPSLAPQGNVPDVLFGQVRHIC